MLNKSCLLPSVTSTDGYSNSSAIMFIALVVFDHICLTPFEATNNAESARNLEIPSESESILKTPVILMCTTAETIGLCCSSVCDTSSELDVVCYGTAPTSER